VPCFRRISPTGWLQVVLCGQSGIGKSAMLIGMLLCGVLAGFGGALWGLIAAESVLMAVVLYPVAGIAGVMLFAALAMLRAGLPGYEPGQEAQAPRQTA
jgi:hypothetical protein